MTNRARWLLFLGLAGLFGGVLRGQYLLASLSLTVFCWILFEWFRFQARMRLEIPRLRFERRINGRSDTTGTLWVGRTAHIELEVTSSAPIQPRLKLRDVVPEILELRFDTPTTKNEAMPRTFGLLNGFRKATERWLGTNRPEVQLPNQWTIEQEFQKLVFQYSVNVRAAGRMVLPGVRVEISDAFRLFVSHRLIPVEQSYRLLPDYFQAGELRPTIKRQNSLPQHGIHRLRRSGTGSELLELREYVPGDPPKSIAWKVSARRDNLMTRQYESEVPVRLHLFIDGSVSTRLGGYGLRLLDQINYVATSVARAAISVGDPVSGMLVDERSSRRLPWLAGDRGFLQLAKALSEFAEARPPAARAATPYMVQCAMRVCYERYPELMERRYHPIPFSFFSSTRQLYRLTGVLAEVFDLTPYEQMECLVDRERLAYHIQELLYQSGMPWMAPMISVAPDAATSAATRMQLLSDAIAKAIAHAKDNEVFVVLADLLSCGPNLSPLLRIVKLALAKHHRVAFVCPTTTFARPDVAVVEPQSNNLNDLLLAAERARVRDIALLMKRELSRLGVQVAFSGEKSAIQMILAEMDLARDGRTRLQGAGMR